MLFLDGILAFFGSTDYIRALGSNVLDILMVLGLGNALAEVLVCTLIGGSLGNACAFPEKRGQKMMPSAAAVAFVLSLY